MNRWGHRLRGHRGPGAATLGPSRTAARSPFERRIASRWAGAKLAIGLLTACSAVQPVQGAEHPREMTDAADLLHYSLQVPVDETGGEQLVSADRQLGKGEVEAAFNRWKSVLESAAAGLVPAGDTLVTKESVVASRIAALGPEQRAAWERFSGPEANAALHKALQRDSPDALWSAARRYPGTDSGQRALEEIAARSFDAGDHLQCIASCRALLDGNPMASARIAATPQLALWWALALERRGNTEAAARTWLRWRANLPPRLPAEFQASGKNADVIRRWESVAEATPLPAGRDQLSDLWPSSTVVWERLAAQSNAVDRAAEQTARDFEAVAHPLLALNTIVPCGNKLLVPMRRQIAALTADGSSAWEWPLDGQASRETPADAVRALLGEGVCHRPVTCGGRVYLVIGETLNDRALVVLDAATGRELWRTSEEYVLGPPTEIEGRAYLLYESDSTLLLSARDAMTGAVQWERPLGRAGLTLDYDPRRHWMPALIVAVEDGLICATGNGALVKIDLLTREICWSHRVEREDWREAGPPLASFPPQAPRYRTWVGWRRPAVIDRVDLVIWAAPEGDGLWALDATSGATRWKHGRGQGLLVEPLTDGILILESMALCCLDARDGSQRWRVTVPALAGEGFEAKGWYIVPLRSGGAVAVRLTDGAVERCVDWNREIRDAADVRPSAFSQLRSFAQSPIGLLSQDTYGVHVLRTVSDDLPSPPIKYAVRSVAEALRAEALRAAALGDLPAAVEKLQAALAADEAPANLDDEFARLQFLQIETQAIQARATSVIACQPERCRLGGLLLAEAFRGEPSAANAVALLAEVCEGGDPQSWIQYEEAPSRRVRADFAALAAIQDRSSDSRATWRQLNSDCVPRLERLLEQWEAAGRAAAIDRLLERLIEFEWGAGRWLDRLEQRQEEFDARDAAFQAETWLRLARIAAAGGDLGARARSLQRWPHGSLRPGWPAETPVVTTRRWTSAAAVNPALRTIVWDGPGSSVQVEIDLTGRDRFSGAVRLSGAGERRPWELPLPKTVRSLGYFREYHRAWILGPLAVVQVGSQLYGIVMFDREGRRGASLLWPAPPDTTIDTWGQVANQDVGFLPRVAAQSPGPQLPDLDEFGRPLAEFGPIRLSYFCMRNFRRLITRDTMTGRVRWVREGLAKHARAVGDERAVVLLSSGDDEVQVLNPLDGLTQGRWRRTFADSDVVQVVGSTAVVLPPLSNADSPRPLAAIDLVTGTAIWRQDVDPGARAFIASTEWVGVVEPGRIRLFSLATGKALPDVAVETPARIEMASAFADPFGVFVLASQAPTVAQSRMPLRATGGPRRPFANGVLFAIDPATGELRWTLPLTETVLPLDQPPDVPVIVVNDGIPPPGDDENMSAEPRLRCYDKRNGRLLFEQTGWDLGLPACVVERSVEDAWVDVRTPRQIIHLDFRSPP